MYGTPGGIRSVLRGAVRYSVLDMTAAKYAKGVPCVRELNQRSLLAPYRVQEGLQFLHELSKDFQRDLLRAVAPGFGRVGMHFNEERVRPHSHRAFAEGFNEV